MHKILRILRLFSSVLVLSVCAKYSSLGYELFISSLSLSSGSGVTVFHRSLQCIVDMMLATKELEEAFTSHSPTHSLCGT